MIVDVTAPAPPRAPALAQAGFERREEAGERSTVSTLTLGAHTGTHVDAPVHFLAGSTGVESLDLDACIGPCVVADLTGVDGHLSAAVLEGATISTGTERLLAKTRNSGWSRETGFREDFCAFDASGAAWCVERGLRLVGIDSLSIEPFGSGGLGNPTHRTLLGAGVVVLEGLELEGVEAGVWELIALPMLVEGGDGAPARVLLRR